MTKEQLLSILNGYRDGSMDETAALEELRGFPATDLGFAVLDSQRHSRQGFPEVVYAEGKSPEHFRAIIGELLRGDAPLLATRARDEHFEAVRDLSPELRFDRISRTISARRMASGALSDRYIAIVTAGTSDLPVAEEAAVTAEVFGNRVVRINDVGVAGIHRLFGRLGEIRGATVVIAVAGMEGALASVIGGLVEAPVIAVPTSIGYGASFGGVSALLTMLNSCAAGVSVVNIDNGFNAGYLASQMMRIGVGKDGE
jgi:NCAIR mutase (PurE)-related protein